MPNNVLNKKSDGEFNMERNPPDGWHPIEAYTNGREIVILGTPPITRTGEEHKHNCQEMGCDLSHIIAVMPYPFPGTFEKSKE